MENNVKLRRWNPWPVSIIVFFAVAIAGCATFIIFCSRHPADLVAADYYEQEVHYQGQMDRMQRAGQQARPASVCYDSAARNIVIAMPSDQAKADLTGTVQLYRPSAATLDRRLKLEPDAEGVQTIDAASLASGFWKVRVSWSLKQQEYFIERSFFIGERAS